MEGERRLGALVVVRVSLAETVAAAARCEVVEGPAEPVAAEEPVEGTLRAFPVLRLAGDAPDASTDSRAFGAVDPTTVRGRPWLRYWPPRRIGRLP